MTTKVNTSGTWRTKVAGIAIAALAMPTVFVGSTLGAPQNAQAQETTSRIESTQLESGALEWGVRYSIRNYLENFGHTNGYVSTFDGAEYRTGDEGAKFPITAGWIDPENDEAQLSFAGRLDMYGMHAHWLHFDNIRLNIADGQAHIVVDLIESYSSAQQVDDVVLAEFDFGTTDVIQENDGEIVISSDEGVFPTEIGENHLPRQDGQATYGEGNDHTDPFTLELSLVPEVEPTPSPTPSPTVTQKPEEKPTEVDDFGEVTDTTKSEPWGESSVTNQYGASLTVSPAYSLADEEQIVQLEGTGFPTEGTDGTSFGGFYVLFGWVDPEAGDAWGPGQGGVAGKTFAYSKDVEPQGTYQSMVNFPGNTTAPDFASIDATGSFATELPIMSSRFESQQGIDIDCYTMQCGVILIGAHGKVQPEGEIFVPVYFTDNAEDIIGDAPETLGNVAPVANPNMLDANQNTGLAVNGGLPHETAPGTLRTVLFIGIFLLSLGLFGAVVVYRRSKTASSVVSWNPRI